MSAPNSKGLQAAFEVARARYGDLGLPLEAYAAHVTKCGKDQPLEELQTDDLYLVCASLRRSSPALAILHKLVWAQEPAIRRMPGIGESTDDLLADVETRLVLDVDGRPAKLREYAGRGKLASWLRIVVVGTALRRKRKGHETMGHSSAMLRASAPDDAELEALQNEHAPQVKAAFERAFKRLTSRERNVLRLNIAHGLGIDGIAKVYGVHRASVARWLAGARKALTDETKRALSEKLGLSSNELNSLVRAVRPRLLSGVERMLREETQT